MAQHLIKQILRDPNEESRNLRMAKYLTDHNLTANQKILVSAAGDTVQVVLSLIGFGGVVKMIKFVFNNKNSLLKVLGVIKCFFIRDGNSGIFLMDGMKNLFLNVNSALFSIVKSGSMVTLKVLKDNVFG